MHELLLARPRAREVGFLEVSLQTWIAHACGVGPPLLPAHLFLLAVGQRPQSIAHLVLLKKLGVVHAFEGRDSLARLRVAELPAIGHRRALEAQTWRAL